MITQYALEQQAILLQTMFATAAIEINGIIKPMPLTSTRDGSKVRFFIDVPAAEVGTITKRIIKTASDQVCWSDPPGAFNVVKPNTDLRTEIPIQVTWKEATS